MMSCKGCYYDRNGCMILKAPILGCYADKEEGLRRENDIKKYYGEAGIKGKKNLIAVGKMVDEKLPALYKQGLTDKEIAKKLNVSDTCIGKHRRKIGVPPNSIKAQSKLKKSLEENFYKLYMKGLSDPQIAKKLGVAASTIWNYRTSNGLSPNRNKSRPVTAGTAQK